MKLAIDLSKAAAVVEGDGEKILKLLTGADAQAVKLVASAPKGIAGLAVLLSAVDKAFADGATDAANPSQLVLNLSTQVSDVKAVWSDAKSVVGDLGIKF